jgi:hypothetical protein
MTTNHAFILGRRGRTKKAPERTGAFQPQNIVVLKIFKQQTNSAVSKPTGF